MWQPVFAVSAKRHMERHDPVEISAPHKSSVPRRSVLTLCAIFGAQLLSPLKLPLNARHLGQSVSERETLASENSYVLLLVQKHPLKCVLPHEDK